MTNFKVNGEAMHYVHNWSTHDQAVDIHTQRDGRIIWIKTGVPSTLKITPETGYTTTMKASQAVK